MLDYQPRYQAFIDAHGKQPNYQYMAFISKMKELYATSLGLVIESDGYCRISDHDGFTEFIETNAARVIL